jgi:hypothetical protein
MKTKFLKAFKATKGTESYWIEYECPHDKDGHYFIGVSVKPDYTIGDNDQTFEHFWVYPDEGMTRADGWKQAIQGLKTIEKI